MSGKLNPGADPVRTFIDTFPAGTLSGASRRVEVRIRFLSMKCRSFMDIEVLIRFLSMKCRCFMEVEVRIGFSDRPFGTATSPTSPSAPSRVASCDGTLESGGW